MSFRPRAGQLAGSGGGCVTNKLFYGDNLDVLRESIADQSLDHACEAGGYDAAGNLL